VAEVEVCRPAGGSVSAGYDELAVNRAVELACILHTGIRARDWMHMVFPLPDGGGMSEKGLLYRSCSPPC
jgi:hypothetical protein